VIERRAFMMDLLGRLPGNRILARGLNKMQAPEAAVDCPQERALEPEGASVFPTAADARAGPSRGMPIWALCRKRTPKEQL